MEERFPGKENNSPTRVNFGERLHEKKVDPSAQANSAKIMLWLSRLDQVDPAGQAKVVLRRKVGPARRVTCLAELTFCFSFKRFATFYKEMYEKLVRLRAARVGGWPSFLGELFFA